MSEVVKFITCLGLVYLETGGVKGLFNSIDKQIIKQPIDTLKVCVPSFVYLVQNNLLYVSASHLDAATYQVCHSEELLIFEFFFNIFLGDLPIKNTHYSFVFCVHFEKDFTKNSMDVIINFDNWSGFGTNGTGT